MELESDGDNVIANMTELNEMIYAGAKLICDKFGVLLGSEKKLKKSGWETRPEG